MVIRFASYSAIVLDYAHVISASRSIVLYCRPTVLLHFACGVAEAKCVLVTAVCVSV